MKKLLLFSFLMLIMSGAFAADYYWVGGSGSWSDVNNHWSSTSGGTPDRSIIPTSGDDVYFDANSGLDANSVITLPDANAACRNMSWVGVTTAATFRAFGAGTTRQLEIYGNLELSATVKYGMTNVRFMGGGNASYKTNGAQRISGSWFNQLLVSKPGGTLKLLDGIPAGLGIGAVTLESGTLDLSGYTHEINRLTSNFPANARTLNLTNATLKAASEFDLATNSTLIASGSTLITGLLWSNGLTFNNVEITGSGTNYTIVNNTFSELLFSNPSSANGSVRIGDNNRIGRLEFRGGGRLFGTGNVNDNLILAPGKGYLVTGTHTVNQSFQFNTPDCDALGAITGAGTIVFGTGATADIRNAYITNLSVTGSITPITILGADGGGNTGFNIQPRATGTTLYWVGGTGSWDDRTHWSTTSGGAGGACVPFTGDNVIFDANSGFTASSKTVSLGSTSWCHNMTWSNVANAPIFNTGTATLEVYGNIELDPTITISGTLLAKGSEESTLTTKGCNLGTLLLRIEKTIGAGGLTLADDINFPQLSIIQYMGKFVMSNRTINMFAYDSASGLARTIDISNSNITVSDKWNLGASSVIWVNNAIGSLVTSNKTFSSNGLSYPKVFCASSEDDVTISATTIAELTFTQTKPSSNLIALKGSNTIGTLEFKGGGSIQGNNTIQNLLLAPSKIYRFRNTQNINGLFRFNNPDCEGLGELRGIEGFTSVLNFGASATKDINNVYVQRLTATGSGVPITVNGADAGGNVGFNFTASISGPRYWVGGSGDWNEKAHWSNTSGGPGGACVPTVSNDVFFDANSFTSSSKSVTISQGNAYCRNLDWTGATHAPTITRSDDVSLEIWGNLVMNPQVNSTLQIVFIGPGNATITPNNATLGTLRMEINKPAGSTLTFLGDYNKPNSPIDIKSGGLNLNGRTVTSYSVSDNDTGNPTSLDVRNATINARWQYTGSNKALQAEGSRITAGLFRANGGTYNSVNVNATAASNINISQTTIADLLFSNDAGSSQALIAANNNIGRLEFKGRGNINGTGNTIGTLIFAPGKIYTFVSGSTTTITKDWFGSGTPCNLTEINSSAAGTFTVSKTVGNVEFDYVRLRNIVAAGTTPFIALEHSENLGGNSNWSIAPYNNTTPILGLGPDKLLCADAFPYTIKTDGFFASPMATFAWSDGSTGTTFVATEPGTYSVTVSYPDGCSRTDNIVLTRSDVTIAPITGTANACVGATTNLSTSTTGGVWSSSNTAVATVSNSGVVTGLTAGTTDITYTVTNGNGCIGAVQQTVTINAMPTVAATTGPNSVFAGDEITLANATTGGVWSSSNTAVATVDATGTVKGVAAGTTDIIYTITGTGGCEVTSTYEITVDAFDPAKRVLNVVKTLDAAEPTTQGAFTIGLPAGVNAIEDITVTYTVSGTAIAGIDYTALSGTATILAGQNSVSVPVSVINDTQIEDTETVVLTLSAGTSTTYTYDINTTESNATIEIADDDDVPANRVLSISSQLNANEPGNTGTFTIALPTGILAPEHITVAYDITGTATNGDDYETLSGTATILAGQNNVVISVKAIDDKIIEQTETIILTLTGGNTAGAGNFTIHATNGTATMFQTDDDNTTTIRTLAVSSNGNAGEPGSNNSFTISLPTGYVSSLPITINYTFAGSATYGQDYSSNSATSITLPAGQNSVDLPITVINDNLIEQTETILLTITNGVAMQGATTAFTLSPSSSAASASMDITDDDNTGANRILSVSSQNGGEPANNGRFTISLPAGISSAENITLNYTVTGNATPAVDYRAITAPIVIPAGQNNVDIPLIVIDDKIIEGTENVIFNLTGASSTSFSFTVSPTASNATAQISDDDAGSNALVLLTKVSDAIEGGVNGQYRVSLPPGVSSAENIIIDFNISGTATAPADYSLTGAITNGKIVIPAGSNEVFIDVVAINDNMVEGPETVMLALTGAESEVTSTTYDIDPTGNNAVITIIDANAESELGLEVLAADVQNATEPATNGSFKIKLVGGVLAYDIIVGYKLSGTALAGLDYQNFGTIVIPAGQSEITVPVNVLDDKIIEGNEELNFEVLSGSAYFLSQAYIIPSNTNKAITININDDDAQVANLLLSVTKNADAAEPDQAGSFTISLPAGYTSSQDITVVNNMTGTADIDTDYTLVPIIIPAYANSVVVPVSVLDDKIIEGAETVTLTISSGSDVRAFQYLAAVGSEEASLTITDDDNTAANRALSAVAGNNATEGGAKGTITLKLPNNITAKNDITIDYTLAGTATSADYETLTGKAIILAGQNNVTIEVEAIDDKIIEPTETIALTIVSGTDGENTFTAATGNETATITIVDNDNTTANKVLSIVSAIHAAEPGTDGAFSIALPTDITSSENITINYTVGGTASASTDYKTLTGSIVLPAGQNSIALPVELIDDKIIELTETVEVTLADAASASLSFTVPAASASLNIADDDNISANRIVSIAKAADAAEPSTDGGFRISLPTGITASQDITINYEIAGTATAGTDYTALSGTAVIPTGQNSVAIQIDVIDDSLIEVTETVIANFIDAASTNFSFNATGSATVNITDNDNISANRIISISKTADATEDGAKGIFKISLPAGITASENVTVNYTISGTATATTDHNAISGSAVILAGQNAVDIMVSAVDDTIIEGTETVIATLTGANSNSFAFTATGNATMNIVDNDNTVANKMIAISKTGDATEGGAAGGFSISLPSGITVSENINVNYTVSGTATAGTDYTALSGTATILAGQNNVLISVTPTDDNIIEITETVVATLNSANSTTFTFATAGSATVNINDDDNTIANRIVSINKTADAAEPATSGVFSISLPTGITASEDITINYTVGGNATAGIDYAALSGSVVITAGQNAVNVPVFVIDDQLIEQTETVVATLVSANSDSFTFSATGNAEVNIVDDENIAVNKVLAITKEDGAEPATNAGFRINLPLDIIPSEDITINYTVSGTAIAGTDYVALSGIATIPAGQNSVLLPITVIDDQIIEQTETVIVTLNSGSSNNYSYTATGSETLNIEDDDNTLASKVLTIVKTTDAAEPSTDGSFNISLPTGITAGENINVNYTVSGTATAGTDYVELSGSAVILAGQNSVTIPLTVIDDNVYEGTETVALTLTGGASANFSFTTSTTNAVATANIADDDKMDQVITFTALPVKILDDPSFTLTATGGSSGNPVTFTSSDPAVAMVSGNVVTIVGVGTTIITASQAGNAIYNAAANVTQALTVIFPLNTVPTLATIDDQQVCLTNTPQTIALSGISAGTEQDQTTTLSVSSTNPSMFSTLSVTQAIGTNAALNYTLNGTAGTASITVTVRDNGGTANGGIDVFSRTFTLTVSPLPQVQIAATPGTSLSKGQTLELTASGASSYTWVTATGIINGQNSAKLTVRPAQTTTYTVTGTSAAGCTSTASITITVMEDYNLVGNNVLTPNGDGKNDFFVVKNIDMYPNNEVRIIDRAGRVVYAKKGYNNEWDGTVSGKPLEEDTYYYIIDLGKGVRPIKGYITIVRKH